MPELIHLTDAMIFNLEDVFARERRARGRHPRPLGAVKFLLVGRVVNGAREDFKPPLEMIIKNSSSGYHLFFGRIKSADRYARRALVDGTRYVVRVESDFYQPIERDDILWPIPRPVDPYSFDLRPGYAYPFPKESSLGGGLGPTLLRGALLSPGGEGIAGATLRVQNQSNDYHTDRTGQWVLVFPDNQASGNVTLDILSADPPTQIQVPNVTVRRGLETGLAQTALSGRVVNQAGVGIGGAIITVDASQGESKTRGDGSWFYYFPLDQAQITVAVTARLSDGRSQTRPNLTVQPKETTPVAVFQFP
jgi:hypothetical protein